MAPTLERVLTMEAVISKDDAALMGSTKGCADRIVQPIIGGALKGDGINATFVQGGSDLIRFDQSAGVAHLDARLLFRDTQSDAWFFSEFRGLVRTDEKMMPVASWKPGAKTTESKDHYAFTWMTFEVSLEEHKWMEKTAFVGHHHYCVHEDGSRSVEFEVYRCVTG